MKNSFIKMPLVLVSIFGIASASVLSEELPLRGPIPFASYDKDGNGYVSEQEFLDVRKERVAAKAAQGRPMKRAGNAPSFARFDENNDGQLTEHELISGQQKQMQNRRANKGKSFNQGQGQRQGKGMGRNSNMPSFSDFDMNNDNVILKDEFYEARAKRIEKRVEQGYPMRNIANPPTFEDIDINDDGGISAKEFKEHKQSQMQNRRANKGKSFNQGQGKKQGKGMGRNSNMPSFSDFDMNNDNVILKDEFYEARAKRIEKRVEQGYPMRNIANPPTFEDIDMNDDGGISAKEFKKHQMMHRKQMMKK